MHGTDRVILEHCLGEFRPVAPLKGTIPSGSLYRHVARLVKLGWLEKQGALYRTTEAGRRQIDSATRGITWDALAEAYPPLALVPTPVHRALIELILAAMVTRQHEIRPDRHPFFVAFGSTLRWKTSLGRFICHAVGLDPARQIVDCGSEAGRSLTFRRGSDGALVSTRALLETSFVVLDEFQTADRSVRNTLGIFLSGRLVTPVENEQLTVRPVPLLTLNPKDAQTLEARVALAPPLIRRALLANLDAVPMPDLAAVGERAVEAARAHPRIEFAAPRTDLRGSHDAIVDLVRAVLVTEAHERIDIEIVANLAAGMTAFIAEPIPAIAQVVHGVGVLAETLGWARPGWTEVVTEFARGQKKPVTGTSSLARIVQPELQAANEVREPARRAAISLIVPQPPPRRRTSVPDLDLSDEMRARLIWFAMETQQDLEVALTTLLDFYLESREESSIATLVATLGLAQQLELAEVEVETLDGYLKTLEQLRKENCDFGDVGEALRLIDVLGALPFAWTWGQAKTAMQAAAAILEAGIDLEDVGEFLERHRQLESLGFDEAAVVAVAEALTRAGASSDRRNAVLETIVEIAGQEVDRASREDECQRLEATVDRLNSAKQRWETSIQEHRDHILRIRGAVAKLNETKVRLQAECDEAAGGLAVVQALRAFLVGRTAEAESLWATLEPLLAWRKRGGQTDDAVGQMWTKDVRHKVVEFFTKLLQETPRP